MIFMFVIFLKKGWSVSGKDIKVKTSFALFSDYTADENYA